MHHVIERFVGRYEVWRRSVPLRNPLNIPALVLVTSIAQAIYRFATSHQVAWGAAVFLAVDIAFFAVVSQEVTLDLACVARLGRDGSDTVAVCSCFRFPPLSFGYQRSCHVFSFGPRSRFYRVGVRDSAALL